MKPIPSNGWKRTANSAVAVVLLIFGTATYADELSLGALKAQGAQALSKDDLAALLPGASLTRQMERGEVHINTVKDGSLNANYQEKARNTGQLKGYGTWKVTDDGKYCFEIKWNRGFENVSGCRLMFKAGDDYYSAAADSDDAKLFHYKISK
jgi:Protein of unknown function (DUF995)